jgi:hypothetical protein
MREHGGIVAELQAQRGNPLRCRNAPGRIDATHAAGHFRLCGVQVGE